MNKPLVSVVIPLFNKEKYIEATLQSVVNQTYSEIELVVIDDASTDRSLELVKSFVKEHQKRFSRVVIRSIENSGQSRARNEGVFISEGDYVAFLDADDIWKPEKIDSQIDYLMNNSSVDLVVCNYFIIDDSATRFKAVRLLPINEKIQAWSILKSYGVGLESTGVVRRPALLNIGGFDTNLQMCSGMDLAFRMSQNKRVGCVDEYLTAYRLVFNGWHNNKLNLEQDYETLFTKHAIYGLIENEARKYLRVHLNFWNARYFFERRNLVALMTSLIRHPYCFISYVFSTGGRILIASIRGRFRRKDLAQLRKMLS